MTFEVLVIDFSQIRGLWETRVKKYKERCKKETQRLETSALQKYFQLRFLVKAVMFAYKHKKDESILENKLPFETSGSIGVPWLFPLNKHSSITRRVKYKDTDGGMGCQRIKQEWNFMLECRNSGIPQSVYLKNGFVDTELEGLDKHERFSSIAKKTLHIKEEPEKDKFIFNLCGENWEELPDYLSKQTHLKEWHINKTLIKVIPEYVQIFQDLKVLDMSQNKLACLPPEIGCLRHLKELNVGFNNLKEIPSELGDCENLEKLDVSGNLELTELPFELSNLKKVTYVDVSANKFSSVPICVLRMSSLQWLDISSNSLQDLPQDIDRLEELETLLLQKNNITYLPFELTNITKLKLLVVSGEHLVEIPSALTENPSLKYVKILDNPIEVCESLDNKNEIENNQDREQFEKEFMKAYLKDLTERDATPTYTKKVSLNLQI